MIGHRLRTRHADCRRVEARFRKASAEKGEPIPEEPMEEIVFHYVATWFLFRDEPARAGSLIDEGVGICMEKGLDALLEEIR